MDKKEKKVKELEKEVQKPDFWDDNQKAADISQELADIKEEIEEAEELKKDIKELKEISELAKGDDDLSEEVAEKIEQLNKKIKKQEIEVFLSSKYDKGNAILSIYSGAGGQDAQDWATMLLRMYERYCQEKGFKTKILHQSFGEGGGPDGRVGTKSVTLEIKGKFAYGFLKKENGVHRLVRISPFSPQDLRHTSFTLVEILPDISQAKEEEIEVKPEDLKIDTFRASGPGGQYVNRRESAIRVTHLPTNIVVSCQSERLQGLNREKAMKLLYAKLYQLKQKEQQKKVKDIKGDTVSAEWGSQIRSYVLHPYKMVKDLRTDVETSDVDGVLDGDLDEFINAEIKI